jgi:hypothetical protein
VLTFERLCERRVLAAIVASLQPFPEGIEVGEISTDGSATNVAAITQNDEALIFSITRESQSRHPTGPYQETASLNLPANSYILELEATAADAAIANLFLPESGAEKSFLLHDEEDPIGQFCVADRSRFIARSGDATLFDVGFGYLVELNERSIATIDSASAILHAHDTIFALGYNDDDAPIAERFDNDLSQLSTIEFAQPQELSDLEFPHFGEATAAYVSNETDSPLSFVGYVAAEEGLEVVEWNEQGEVRRTLGSFEGSYLEATTNVIVADSGDSVTLRFTSKHIADWLGVEAFAPVDAISLLKSQGIDFGVADEDVFIDDVESDGFQTLTVTGIRFLEDGSSESFIVDISNAAPFQNPVDIHDVNADGITTPLDALLIINRLNSISRDGSIDNNLLTAQVNQDMPFVDVTADGAITPLDALRVINQLNRQQRV